MANFQIGQPGVSAFLQSLLRDLDVVVEMDDFIHVQIEMELKEMKKLLLGFKCILLDGERKRQHGDTDAERWMDDLKDLFYDIDDLLDEVKIEKQLLQPEITGEPSDSKVRYNYQHGFSTQTNIKSMLKQVVDKLRELTQEANRLQLKRDAVQNDSIWLESQAKVRQKPGCYADEFAIHGRKEDKERIIEMLLADDGGERRRNYEFVCVVGMGGLGKTTLAQLVFQDERVKHSFAVRSWACISDVFDVIKVTQDLIESAEVNAGKGDCAAKMSGLAALQARLQKIINGQKFLLVLDDVWIANVFEELKGPLNIGAKGSKILVTTRLTKVAEDLKNKEPYPLEPLEDAQCLKIFNDNAFGEEDGIDNDRDLMKLGEEIVKKCKGVPLVAKIIGAMLTGKDEEEWKAVKDDGIWDLAYKGGDLHPGLRLSYFYLPPYLKRCFEYLALFPTDSEFNRRRLVLFWMAEGLIEVKEGREPEEIGNQYYNELKGRSLIQEDSKIHDMVHHLACIVSGSSFFRGVSGSSSSTSSLQCVRHAFTQEVLINASKLRTLFHDGELGQELFSYKRLRVLTVRTSLSHLSGSLGCHLKHLRSLFLLGKFLNNTLLESICTVTNLQVLVLSDCKDLSQNVGKLQDVGKLINLRFLKIESSGITVLPDIICTLTNLRELDLSYCKNLHILPQDVGKLLNLRFLRLVSSGITVLPNSVCSILNLQVLNLSSCKSLTSLPKDMGNLQSLDKLKLERSSISSLPESLVEATNIRVLRIDYKVALPAYIGKLMKLEKYLWKFCVGKENGRGINELKGMNRLRGSLRIENMENIESAEEALMANLRSKKHIEKLKFVWKEFDTALTGRDGEMEMRVMEALEPNAAIQSLSLKNYVGHKVPSWMSTPPLRNLTSLKLISLPLMAELTEMELESLISLRIDNCCALREVAMTIPKLEILIVANCNELIALMLSPYLKVLFISECSKLRNLPNGLLDLTSLRNLTFLKLFSLPLMAELTGMELESLISLRIDNCLALREVAMTTPKLERLTVENCNELITLMLSPYLKELYIRKCSKLRNLPIGLHDLNSLRRIEFLNCPCLEIRPPNTLPSSITIKEIVGCPKLEEWKTEEEDLG